MAKKIFEPDNPKPFKVSRSKIENFIRCKACFWMDRVKGINFPGMPGFNLNSATDSLMKKDFDKYRELQKPHPFMIRNGLEHLVPFKYFEFEQWTQARKFGLRTIHKPTNLLIGGGLDDVWHDRATEKIFMVEYKSTSTIHKPITLEGNWKKGYKRQIDIYQWILRQNGFDVSDMSYFVYVNADASVEDGYLEDKKDKANMIFDVQLIEYVGDDSWVEDVLFEIKDVLHQKTCPKHATSGFGYKGDKECENAHLFKAMEDHYLALFEEGMFE